MDKFSFITLWDTYNGLLTPTQQEITNLYFNLDLTASEIAAEKNISRQAVSECLKGCKKQLEEYEEKLHFCRRAHGICLEFTFMKADALKWTENFLTAHPQFKKEIDGLCEILQRDYFSEAEEVLKNPELSAPLYKDFTEKVYGRVKNGEE